jgi:WD40 repeat protein
MSPCPSSEELLLLLADQLSAARREALEAHVETCAACQETLARLSDAEEGQTPPFPASSSTPLPASELDFVQHLREHPPSTAEGASRPTDEGGQEPIRFPGRPTEKGPLGQLDGFAIRKELGSGSFSVVYQALDELDRFVALKVLKPELAASGSERARFELEGRKAAAVKHDHIVTIHQVRHTPGFASPYLVMEYIEGEPLNDRLRRQGPMQPREAARMVRHIALALADAHAKGLVHRDVKPSNILLEASSGRAKLTDFGLARVLEAAGGVASQSGRIVGTPGYMSPEQITTPQRIDGRSDLYSLGVVLYELLTGERPFRGVGHVLLQQVVHDEPRPPRKLNEAIPRDLETITLKCLAKDPSHRYQTAQALADDLQRWLDGLSIQARPVGVAGQAARWCRRKPALAIASSLAVVALLAAAGMTVSLLVYQSGILRAQQSQLSAVAMDTGLSRCLEGESSEGMLWLAHALELVPAGAEDLDRVLRTNLAGWRHRVHPLKAVLSHDEPVVAVAFRGDGQIVFTTTRHKAYLWSTATGEPIGQPFLVEGEVHAAAFSPDGKTIVTAGEDEAARLWDATTGQPIGQPFWHEKAILALTFSPDSKMVLTGSADGKAQLWDAATGQPIGQPFRHESPVRGVAFSPDGKVALTESRILARNIVASDFVHVHRWDVGTGQPVAQPLPLKRADPRQEGFVGDRTVVGFSGDGKRIVTDLFVDKPQVWDLVTGQPVGKPLPHQGELTAVAFSPNGLLLLKANEQRTARVWELKTGKPVGPPLHHQDDVTSVAISPDGRTMLTGSKDTTARLWEVAPAEFHRAVLTHEASVTGVGFSRAGERVITGSEDHTARVWEVPTGQLCCPPLRGHHDEVLAVALSADGKLALTGSADGTAQLWDTTTGMPLGLPLRHEDRPGKVKFAPDGKPINRVWAVALSPDGTIAVTGSDDQTARLWSTATGQPLGEPLRHRAGVTSVAFSPDGKMILTTSADGTARFWEAATGRLMDQINPGQGTLNAAALSSDSRWLLTVPCHGIPELWELSAKLRHGIPLRHWEVQSAAFSPDHRLALTGGLYKTTRLWDTNTGRARGTSIRQEGAIRSVAFSPDGRLFLTGSDDHTAQLFDVATLKPYGPPLEHLGSIRQVAFSPDSNTIVTASADATARLWDVPRPVPVTGVVSRLVHWTKVISGMEIDDGGEEQPLDAQMWDKYRRLLKEQGGPP